MPQWGENSLVAITAPFVGEGWHLTLGLLFMLIVIFLPGGVMEGFQKIKSRFFDKQSKEDSSASKESNNV
jgi:Na+-transporting methylmalonyl-CoA/oxaloacetate decarboxylase gamma subunit